MKNDHIDIATTLANMARDHFSNISGFSKEDTDLAMGWLNLTLDVVIAYGFPITHPKYIEVLRVMANTIEAVPKPINDN